MNKNKFAVTPPMGWNSYDYYDTTVSEEQVKKNAEYMAAHLKKFGYEYVVVDIEWYSNDAGTKRKEFQYIPFGDDVMDEFGRFQPSPGRFPSPATPSAATLPPSPGRSERFWTAIPSRTATPWKFPGPMRI